MLIKRGNGLPEDNAACIVKHTVGLFVDCVAKYYFL